MTNQNTAKAIMQELYSTGNRYRISEDGVHYFVSVTGDQGVVTSSDNSLTVVIPLAEACEVIANKSVKSLVGSVGESEESEGTVSVREIPHKDYREFTFTNTRGNYITIYQNSRGDGSYGGFYLERSNYSNTGKVGVHWDAVTKRVLPRLGFMGVLDTNTLALLRADLDEVEEISDYVNDYMHHL